MSALADAVVHVPCVQDGPALACSAGTLEELRNVEVVPAASLPGLAQPPSLSRFSQLQRLYVYVFVCALYVSVSGALAMNVFCELSLLAAWVPHQSPLRMWEAMQHVRCTAGPDHTMRCSSRRCPTMTRDSRRLTLCGFRQRVVGLPQLPVSLRHLVLDGRAGVGPDCEPPLKVRLSGLTRLETLSLLGCAVNALEDEYLGSYSLSATALPEPLPPSLRTLRLDAPELSVDLSRHTLSTASDLTLEVSVGAVACDIGFHSADEWAEPACTLLYLSTDLPDDVRSSEAASLLPDGVRTLSLTTGAVSIACAYMPWILVPEVVREEDAVHALCELFSTAPDSYREFQLRRGSEPAFGIHLLWNDNRNLDFPHHKPFFFEDMTMLANAMQDSAHECGLDVSLCDDQSCCVVSRSAEDEEVMECAVMRLAV